MDIDEKLGVVLANLEKLYTCSGLAVLNGEPIDREKSLVEANVTEGDTIYIFGIVSSDVVASGKISFFKRFKDFKPSDSWYVGENKWDALIFIPKKDIKIYGIGLFEKHPNGAPMTLGYKYIIEDLSGTEISKTEVFRENVEPVDVEGHIIQHKFENHKTGIIVRVGQRFHYIQWISVDRCWYSESGNDYRTVENPDMDLFTIETSDKSSNSTS